MTPSYLYRKAKDGRIYPYQGLRNLLKRMGGVMGGRALARMRNCHSPVKTWPIRERLRFAARLEAAKRL